MKRKLTTTSNFKKNKKIKYMPSEIWVLILDYLRIPKCYFILKKLNKSNHKYFNSIHFYNIQFKLKENPRFILSKKGYINIKLMGNSKKITDELFVNLKGIKKLNMSRCRKITDKAFIHLKGY